MNSSTLHNYNFEKLNIKENVSIFFQRMMKIQDDIDYYNHGGQDITVTV